MIDQISDKWLNNNQIDWENIQHFENFKREEMTDEQIKNQPGVHNTGASNFEACINFLCRVWALSDLYPNYCDRFSVPESENISADRILYERNAIRNATIFAISKHHFGMLSTTLAENIRDTAAPEKDNHFELP